MMLCEHLADASLCIVCMEKRLKNDLLSLGAPTYNWEKNWFEPIREIYGEKQESLNTKPDWIRKALRHDALEVGIDVDNVNWSNEELAENIVKRRKLHGEIRSSKKDSAEEKAWF
ncbi:MAG TPA: hypothetical protein VMW39_06870 [bacterium]|nr:hypothetical protein [bacterium]